MSLLALTLAFVFALSLGNTGSPPVAAAVSLLVLLALAAVLYRFLGTVSPFPTSLVAVVVSWVADPFVPGLSLFTAPLLVALAGGEYAGRRASGRATHRLAAQTERAILVGVVASLAWTALAWVLLPASDGFGVVFDEFGTEPWTTVQTGLYVLAGPTLVVGVPLSLALSRRLVTPLSLTAVEVVFFLRSPGAGDSVGTPASLLWPFGLLLVFALALVEWTIRERVRRAFERRRDGDSEDDPASTAT
ncbi:hypothetical protein AUR64_01140 [Haloprofundus marisrubri]|uniref:Uncharacterized protein n=1 Tax=Haloprofundus marisrubri TaxID=1514971 RepID=A0A0W1R3E3_9EURY|nr:hypothetical protein AUR64_01140 [Haloprofundus marisrubri]